MISSLDPMFDFGAKWYCTIGEDHSYHYTLAARKGVILKHVASAFLAEASALDCCLDLLIAVLEAKIA